MLNVYLLENDVPPRMLYWWGARGRRTEKNVCIGKI